MKHLADMALFVEVVRKKSFRGAAAALGMPSSTLSRRINALERSLGLRLLNRTTRRIELTAAGGIYFERSVRIVDEVRLAHEELASLADQPKGVLHVSLPVDFAQLFLAPHLAEFCSRYPDMEFKLDLTPRRIDLVTEPFDLAIRMGALPDSQLIARQLVKIPRHLYASPSYVDRLGVPNVPDELRTHECLLFPKETHWVLNCGPAVKDFEVNGRFRLNNVGMMRELAVQGLGIAMLARESAAADLAEGRLVRLLPKWSAPSIPVHALTATRLIPARVQRFMDFLKDRLNGQSVAST